MSIKATALDPGGTTGYCLAFIGEPKKLYIAYGQHAWREDQLYNALCDVSPDVLICESFEFRQGARAGLDLAPAHLIGVVRLYAAIRPCELHMQTAAQAKGWWTDQKLKERNLYDRHFRHGRDAARHFLHNFMFGSLAKYFVEDTDVELVEEQYLLDSYFDRVVVS
jgi:hypothetical protein